jgi:DNA-binding transcriptional LysR family regulator
MGGTFRETLEAGAGKLVWPLKIVMSCSSFTQAARLVLSGNYGGVLPGIARVDFDPTRVIEIPLPFLKHYSRKLRVAWNPRLVEVRPFIARAVEALRSGA